jgi:hypothetical protein
MNNLNKHGDPECPSEASRERCEERVAVATAPGDHGGWCGDQEAHSEASREGWEVRRGGDYDDDRRYRSSDRGRHATS